MAQFFAYPLNYGGSRSQHKAVADNDYRTFTTSTSMLLHIDSKGDGSGDARAWTDIFVKCKAVSSWTAAFTDGQNIPSPSPFPRTLPQTVTNDSGDTVSTVVDGYQHDLHNIYLDESTAKPKAKSITLTFTGSSPKIYEVMILDRLLTLNSDGGFSRIEYDNLDMGSYESDLRGQRTYVPALGGTRDKWLVNLTLNSLRAGNSRDTIADDLLHFIRRYKSFVFAPEYNRYPDRVFPAGWDDQRSAVRYFARWKGAGRKISFSIREK